MREYGHKSPYSSQPSKKILGNAHILADPLIKCLAKTVLNVNNLPSDTDRRNAKKI